MDYPNTSNISEIGTSKPGIEPARRTERRLLLLAALFLVLAFSYSLLSQNLPILTAVIPLITILLAAGTAHLVISRAVPDCDPIILPLVTCLSGLGLVMLQRLAPNFLWRQLLWLLMGMTVMTLSSAFPTNLKWLRRYRYSWLTLGLSILASTFVFGVNPLGRGARLWMGMGGIYFQPSEFLKIVFVVFLASYLAEKQELIRFKSSDINHSSLSPLPYVAPMLLIWCVTLALLVAQQDLGAGTSLFATFVAMLYLSSRQGRYVLLGLLLVILAGLVSYHISDFAALRINTWIDPWSKSQGSGYQIIQSLMSFAAGGLSGTGIGRGYGAIYIPLVHTDFVFAAIGEELGLCGAVALIAMYVVLLYRGIWIAMHTNNSFDRLLAVGLTVGIVFQAWIIMAGNLKVLPLTGVTLPFVSYGGSSLLSSYISIGVILNISARSPGSLSYDIPSLTEIIREKTLLPQ